MGDPYHEMLKQLRVIQTAVPPLERARMATDFLQNVDSLARQATAIRDVALNELVDGGDLSYAKAADRVSLSKSMVAKVRRAGRSGEEVKRLAVHIPTKPIEQSIWKDEVCLWYAHGESVDVAMERATATARRNNPGFEPRYDPQLLTF
jgi:hypothetical protein